MKFGENDHDKDSDRRAWRTYAAAAMRILVPMSDPIAPEQFIGIAAGIADHMLAEERKRR